MSRVLNPILSHINFASHHITLCAASKNNKMAERVKLLPGTRHIYISYPWRSFITERRLNRASIARDFANRLVISTPRAESNCSWRQLAAFHLCTGAWASLVFFPRFRRYWGTCYFRRQAGPTDYSCLYMCVSINGGFVLPA